MSTGPRGYSLPLSPRGHASIIPSPPWHYVGDFLVIEFWADPDAVAAVLPPRLAPYADDPGRCAALFVDWQSCSDSGEELLDPVVSDEDEPLVPLDELPPRPLLELEEESLLLLELPGELDPPLELDPEDWA
jgi:acetoacetate decarboxylase